jgi:hypothetical protein
MRRPWAPAFGGRLKLPAVAFRFRLVDTEGRDLGEQEFENEAFKPGDTITVAATLHLRVVAVDFEPEGAELSGTLTVEHA